MLKVLKMNFGTGINVYDVTADDRKTSYRFKWSGADRCHK